MKNNKPALILAGAIAAIFVISLVIRFVALSELGLPGGWTLYFGLPVGGIGLLILLLRLGLLNFGQEPSATPGYAQGSVLPTLEELARQFPQFEILELLGQGGMGVVDLARNRLILRDEVLKLIGQEIVRQPGMMDRFLREIRAVCRLRHPNIVSAYTAFRCGDSLVPAQRYNDRCGTGQQQAARHPPVHMAEPEIDGEFRLRGRHPFQ